MILVDLEEQIRVAYKKLKQQVYYEKHPLALRRRVAEFECSTQFEKRLDILRKVLESSQPHETKEFVAWLSQINYLTIPKKIEDPKPENSLGNFVSNYTSAPNHEVSKVNYLFDGPIELHLISVLWLMVEGHHYDNLLSEHSLGSRLHEYVGSNNDHSAYLYKKYHLLYAKWRDSGIEKAKSLLEDESQNVALIGLDIQEYFYRIQLDWSHLRTAISRPDEADQFVALFEGSRLLGGRLFDCLEKTCEAFKNKIGPLLASSHPSLPEEASCLPIGLSASPVIANWYLSSFDEAVLENVRPAYYGRYIDDIFLVVPLHGPPTSENPIQELIEKVLAKAEVVSADPTELSRYQICSRPSLYLQQGKCSIQYFDSEHSTAGLDKFQKQLQENASDFALLPVDEDYSPVAQVAYDLLYDGSVNKFRSVKAISENKWALAVHLAKQTQLHLMTSGGLESDLKNELFKFFKGVNAITYWDLWERVFALFVVANAKEEAIQLRIELLSEIYKIRFTTSSTDIPQELKNVGTALRESLKNHLDECQLISEAITNNIGNGETSHYGVWRNSNMIRHHFVAVPLLNFTDFDGNLANPAIGSKFTIDATKAQNSPRFIRFDECLSFVSSEFAKFSNKDLVESANGVYKLFHGSKHPDIESKSVSKGVK